MKGWVKMTGKTKDEFTQDSMSFTCCQLLTYSFIILVSLAHSYTCKPFFG